MGYIDDNYFRFPVKVYDQVDLRSRERNEEDFGANIEEPWFVAGWARLHLSELEQLHWHEGFTQGQSKSEVEKKGGMDLTIVYSKTHGQVCCTWNMKDFEKELEIFLERNEEKLYIARKKIERSK